MGYPHGHEGPKVFCMSYTSRLILLSVCDSCTLFILARADATF